MTAPPPTLAQEIAARLDALERPAPRGFAKWTPAKLAQGFFIFLGFGILLIVMPNTLFDPHVRHVTWTLGLLGLWRFGWWFNHAVRAEIRRAFVWPRLRRRRDAIWRKGWRPRHLFVQMTTYNERPSITGHVLAALFAEIRATGIPTTIYVGTSGPYDEHVITRFAETMASDLDAELVFIRQNRPGKRMAIGLVMRAIIRARPHPDDLLLFMDGDAVLGRGCIARSAAMFAADPELEALTTDEDVICFGPAWVRRWLEMRFAQRRLAMQSHALAGKVLTLTGRMSMFRARKVCNEGFVRTIEADTLDHWLWGRFRFLSGDDKSTWYYLLSLGAKMTFVPDARVYTIEIIEGSGIKRMVQNLRRWSGNMLRNGQRAIALGPARVGPFIWWCLVDQRIAMWTMLVSPTVAVLAAIADWHYFRSLLLWMLFSRIGLSLWLFRFNRTVDWSWPVILYANQLINACVKVRLVYFPNRQAWANRGNQKVGLADGVLARARGAVAWTQLSLTVTLFVYAVMSVSGFLVPPTL